MHFLGSRYFTSLTWPKLRFCQKSEEETFTQLLVFLFLAKSQQSTQSARKLHAKSLTWMLQTQIFIWILRARVATWWRGAVEIRVHPWWSFAACHVLAANVQKSVFKKVRRKKDRRRLSSHKRAFLNKQQFWNKSVIKPVIFFPCFTHVSHSGLLPVFSQEFTCTIFASWMPNHDMQGTLAHPQMSFNLALLFGSSWQRRSS